MMPSQQAFERSAREQIARNLERTPTERFRAFIDLLDSVRAMMPTGPEAREREARRRAIRLREREQMRAHFRVLIDTGRAGPPQSV